MFWYLMVFAALCGAAWGIRKALICRPGEDGHLIRLPPAAMRHLPLQGKAFKGKEKDDV